MAFRSAAVVFAALVLAPAAVAADAPTGLHAFQLKANEPEKPTHTFGRTPAFAWNPVSGADRYEFQISTSRRFTENAVVWEDTEIDGTLTTVPLTLPWSSGARYSFYARVRAVVDGEETPWSTRYGFNMRAKGAPRSLSNGVNPMPGMIRWTPIDGATAYEVVFLYELGQGKKKKIKASTTAADLREYYTLHNGVDWANVIFWRVRAVREPDAKTAKNGLPSVTYGPWSARNRTVEPAFDTASSLQINGAISRSRPKQDIRSPNATTEEAGPHELVPGFWWSGALSPAPEQLGLCSSITDLFGVTCPLFHVYVYTDADCVNRVHTSDLVGSPAYVPRLSPPLELPADSKALASAANVWLGDGSEGDVIDAGGDRVKATGVIEEDEQPTETTEDSGGTDETSESGSSDTSGSGDSSDESTQTEEQSSSSEVILDRRNGLWDNDAETGRYYVTVVPVVPLLVFEDDSGEAKVEWHDVAFGQDMCANGDAAVFGKTSAVVVEKESGVPYASGMSSNGTLVGAKTASPTFFGEPVVAWKPAPGAQAYQVQWSKRQYPWKPAGSLITPATAAQLDLPVGKWYYRIRGLDPTLPGPPGLTWSEISEITIMPPTYVVESKSASLRKKARRKARR